LIIGLREIEGVNLYSYNYYLESICLLILHTKYYAILLNDIKMITVMSR